MSIVGFTASHLVHGILGSSQVVTAEQCVRGHGS